jgi:hypothetical protein
MSIEKKSLISTLKTTKKANVAKEDFAEVGAVNAGVKSPARHIAGRMVTAGKTAGRAVTAGKTAGRAATAGKTAGRAATAGRTAGRMTTTGRK